MMLWTCAVQAQVPISTWNSFVQNSDGSWYEFDASNTNLSNGFVSESDIENAFNASDAFMGLKYKNTRFKFESNVPEMGIPGLLAFTPTGANNANYQERIAVPKSKDKDYTPAREVAVRMDYFLINPGASKAGNVDTDIRTYYPEPHVKRNGLSTHISRPGPGTNPVPDGKGCEFVLLSQYGPNTYNNNFPYGNKGDVYGQSLPQGFTTFDLTGQYESFNPNSNTYRKDRTVFAVGLYAHDVTDYSYQSQIYPCYPGTNIRLTFPSNELIQNRFLIGLNTTTNGVSNQDGYFHWWIKIPSINNGQWFLAATLTGRDFTGNVAMNLANLGIGQYNGGNGKGYYLDDGKTANGLWYSNMSVYYKNGASSGGGGNTGNNKPTVAMTSPSGGTVFAPGSAIDLVAAASDSDGSIAKVEFFEGGNNLLGTEYQAPYNIQWNNVPSGTYTLTAKATDNSGNTTTSAPVTITVLNQSGQNPPTVQLTSPVSGALFQDPATVSMTASAADPDGSVVKVEFWEGNTLLYSDGNAPYSFNWTNVPAGNYILKAVAVDNSNLKSTSSTVNISVSGPKAAPVVVINNPGNNSEFDEGDDIKMDATATDADGTISTVEFFLNNQLIQTEKNYPYEATWQNATPGTHKIKAIATDNDNQKTTSAEITIVVKAVQTGSVNPTVSFIEPLAGSSFNPGDNVSIEVNALDPGGSINKVEFYLNNVLFHTENNAPYEALIQNVQTGNYSLKAVAYDNEGNTGNSVISYTVGLSTQNRPDVNLIKPTDGAQFATGSDIDVQATATDNDGSISKVEFYLDGVKWRTEKVDPYTGELKNVQPGTYELMAIGYDNLGLRDTSIITYSVGNVAPQPPVVAIVNPLDGVVVQPGDQVKIDVDAYDPDGQIEKVEIYVGNNLIQTEKNYPYEATWSGQTPGTYTLRAIAYDKTGLTTVSDIVLVTISGTIPEVKGLSFDVTPDDGLVILSWISQSEQMMDFYRVSRSSDSLIYEELSTVAAVGNATVASYYDEIDLEPLQEVVWYKLEAYGTDGSLINTIIVRADLGMPSLLTKWVVYPNPLSGNRPIRIWALLLDDVEVVVEISNSFGSIIQTQTVQFYEGSNYHKVGLKTLPPGLYFFSLRLKDTGQVLDTKLFIKTP